MGTDVLDHAIEVANTAAVVTNIGKVGGGASMMTIFLVENAALFGAIAALVSIFVAIGGFITNQYWQKRRTDLEYEQLKILRAQNPPSQNPKDS